MKELAIWLDRNVRNVYEMVFTVTPLNQMSLEHKYFKLYVLFACASGITRSMGITDICE